MSTKRADLNSRNNDIYNDAFREERRNKYIVGVLALILFAAVAMGILYYFGFMSGVAW